MPMQLDTGAIKAESRSLLRTGEVNPFRMTLFYLLITLVLDMINSGVSYMIDSAGGFTVLSFSFVSILVGLVALVLNAGYYCYCFGILRREEMPYESLFDAFPFAGKVILLSIVEGVFIFLWSMLFVIPGIIAAYRYSFAMLNLCENPELGVMEALNLSKQQTLRLQSGSCLCSSSASSAIRSLLVLGIFAASTSCVVASPPARHASSASMFGSLLICSVLAAGRGRLPDTVSESFHLPLLPACHRRSGRRHRAAALRLLERQLLNAAKKRDISHEISLCHFLFYFST